MPDPAERHLPTWAVALIALAVPVVIAVLFLLIFGWIDRPISVEEWTSDPNMGQKVSDRNNALVLLYAAAQLAFLVLGAWRVARRPEVRVVFLFIAIPVSGLAFLLAVASLMAK